MKFSKALAAATIGILPLTSAMGEEEGPARGAEVGELAGNCNIGPFEQVSKAGQYNVLCNVMSDSEKCLALLKRQFRANGAVKPVNESEVERMKYCLATLATDLGVSE